MLILILQYLVIQYYLVNKYFNKKKLYLIKYF